MSLRQIRYFIAVVESGGFTAASRSLSVSQPALTLQIGLLEQRLGVHLLTRHTRGATLTEAGKPYFDHVKAAIDHLTKAELSISTMPAQITFGLTPTSGRALITDLLDGFATLQPSPKLVIREDITDKLWQDVAAGRLDVACGYEPPGTYNLRFFPLYTEQLVLVAPPAVLDDSNAPVNAADLGRYPLVLGQRCHATRRLIEDTAAGYGVDLKTAPEVEQVTLKREMLLRQACCSIVPPGLFHEEIQTGQLIARRLIPEIHRQAGLIFAEHISVSVEKVLVNLVRKVVRRHILANALGWRDIAASSP